MGLVHKNSLEATEMMFRLFSQVHAGQLSRSEAAELLSAQIDGYKTGTYIRYMDSYLHMRNGTSFCSVLPIALALYFLNRIDEEYGAKHSLQAFQATEQHIRYYSGVSASLSRGLRKALKAFAAEHHFPYTLETL